MTSAIDFFDSVGFSDDPTTMLSQLVDYGIIINQDGLDPVNNSRDLDAVKIYSVTSYKNKLEDIKDSMNIHYVDEFIELTNCWGTTGTVQVLGGVGGQVGLTTGSNTNDFAGLDFAIKSLDINCKFMISFRFQLGQTGNTILELGGIDDNDNLTRFIYDSSSGPEWVAESRLSGTSSTTTLSNTADSKWHTFKISATSTSLNYFIDQSLAATHTSNLPSSMMKMYVKLTTLDNSSKTGTIDFVKHSSLRLS